MKYILAAVFALSCSTAMHGQKPQIAGPVIDSVRVYIHGQIHPMAQERFESGRLSSSMRLSANLVFKRSAEQEAGLKALLAAQQNPLSPSYRQWLTPESFGQRFGMADADLETVKRWLKSQGIAVESVSRSRTSLRFSASAAVIEKAFGTEFHLYTVSGKRYWANSQELSLPAAIAPVVSGFENLNSFPIRPYARIGRKRMPRSNYTYSKDGSHYLAPDDLATIYDIQALFAAGLNGKGQTIAVMGQTTVDLGNVSDFQGAFNLSGPTPTTMLVPETGSGIACADDQTEADLDLEWSGAVAREANIAYIYSGPGPGGSCDSRSYGVFDSLQYAIDNNSASVISISYGSCEANFTSSDIGTLTSLGEQANSQGQTIVAAAGDAGAADCDVSSGSSTYVTSATQGLAVDLPAAMPYVTGVGGAEFNEDSESYWNSSNTNNEGSAKSYIPEKGWNDTATSIGDGYGLAAGGGGKSTLFSKPSWQSAEGVPNDNARDVPDIALAASPDHDGYLYCDASQCASGYFSVVGGTSVGAPAFAGLVGILNQKTGAAQGNVNSAIYSAYNSTPSAFHDITAGDNKVPCTSGTTDCPSSGYLGYSAGTGYDLATGLGSVDAYALIEAIGSSVKSSTTTSVAVSSNPSVGAQVTFTATVAAGSGTPTGTVSFLVDGSSLGSAQSLSNGTATATDTFNSSGTHTVSAAYSGDSSYSASSSSSVSFTVSGSSQNYATTTSLTASSSTIDSGQAVTLTATVSSSQSSPSLTGTVGFAAVGASSSLGTATLGASTASAGAQQASASLTTSALSTGQNALTATYSGDSTFAGSSGSTTVGVVSPSFTLSSSNVSVSSGGTARTQVTVTSANGFAGQVTLSATAPSSLDASTISISPSTVTIDGTSAQSATISIATTKSSRMEYLEKDGNEPLLALSASSDGLLLACVFALPYFKRRRVALFLPLVISACGLISGCGSSSSKSTASATAQGTYTITVRGASGSLNETTTFTLTVN